MQKPKSSSPPVAGVARLGRASSRANSLARPSRPRTALRPRHLEAHAVAWLRSLRNAGAGRPLGAPRSSSLNAPVSRGSR
jgi:hypothetical protein